MNAALVLGGLLVLIWPRLLPVPADKYSLHETLKPPTERELILLTADGEPFARRGGCLDTPVTLDEVPRHFIDALLAMEDRRFNNHFGVDPRGVFRAAVVNYNTGRIVQGGSTITQQLAKISYLSGVRTFDRKLEEALIALYLELNLGKDEILERYLNQVYFGLGCYGLRAAARRFFDRPVNELTLAESVLLVALLKSPTELSGDPDMLQHRMRLVLDAMVESKRLDPSVAAEVEPARLPPPPRENPLGAYYADWIADTIELPNNGDISPLPVQTTFDPELQEIANKAVRHVLDRAGASHKAGQAALVAMRPDGKVLAMVGGRDYDESQFNRAAQAMRQPGSSFKTFVYLAALRAGAEPDMAVSDTPVSIGDWSPENYDHRYRGVVSLRRAFTSSLNAATVRVSEAVGRGRVAKTAHDLGITSSLRVMPSIALGASEVTLLELTSAYAAIAAGAYPVRPWGVLATGSDDTGSARPPAEAGRWKLAAGDTMRNLLRAVVLYGTGRGARLPVRAYGKTGTSQEYRDAWFIGFAGNLTVGVWVGNDDYSPMRRVTGGSLPALIWRNFMMEARRKDPDFQPRLPRIAAFEAEPGRSFKKIPKPDLKAKLAPDAAKAVADAPSGKQRRRANSNKPSRSARPSLFGDVPDGTEKREGSRKSGPGRRNKDLYDYVFGRPGG